MTALFVLRHPETVWNDESRYQGRLDSPLSDHGQQQVQRVTAAFDREIVHAVYTSPLKRARILADAVANVTEAPLKTDERLTEIGQCPWEGLYVDEIRSRYPDLFEQWYACPEKVRFTSWEPLSNLRRRAMSAIASIMCENPDQNVIVVTHSVVIQVLVASALGLDLRFIHQLRIANGSITTLCGTDAPGALLSLNNTDALYQSPIAGAAAQNCAVWQARRVTQ